MKTMIKTALFAATLGLMGQGLTANVISDVHSSIQNEKRYQDRETLRNAIKNALTPEQIEKLAKEEQEEREQNEKSNQDYREQGAMLALSGLSLTLGLTLFGYMVFDRIGDRIGASLTSWLQTNMQKVIKEATKDITKVIVTK